MKKRMWVLMAVAVCLTMGLGANGHTAEKARLTWTAGGTGGGWFVQAGGIAQTIQEKVPNIQINITKAICESKDRLPKIHKILAAFNPPTAWMDMPAPLHPGAERYYKEMGYMK